jgi:hypothetical protein
LIPTWIWAARSGKLPKCRGGPVVLLGQSISQEADGAITYPPEAWDTGGDKELVVFTMATIGVSEALEELNGKD